MPRSNGIMLDKDNARVLNGIRNDASLEYQKRVPEVTQANISEAIEALGKYRPNWNEFVDALINRIGGVIARDMSWRNPLSEFKRGVIEYGDTLEEYKVGLVKSRNYSMKRDHLERDIFGKYSPHVESYFHTVTRQEYYPITVNEAQLRRAFTEQGGLSSFVSSLLESPITSDNLDEFLLTCSLFAEYEKNNGFYHVRVPDLTTLSATKADSDAALKKLRAMAAEMRFLSTDFNAARMPTFANPDDVVLFATPNFVANIDVMSLAAAFNIERADVDYRIVQIPQKYFGIDGCQAILTTKDFFVIADTLVENTSQYNPVSMGTNYFFHHHEIISASLFAPAIMLHTTKDDEVVVVRPKNIVVGELTMTNSAGDVLTEAIPGTNVKITAPVTGDIEGFDIGVDYDVAGVKGQRTRIDNEGVLSVDASETATTLTITATVTYVDPADPSAKPATATRAITVKVADAIPEWPNLKKTNPPVIP